MFECKFDLLWLSCQKQKYNEVYRQTKLRTFLNIVEIGKRIHYKNFHVVQFVTCF